MRIKADWTSYLHDLRRREMNVVFGRCPRKLFGKVLELGAGDGFVSKILEQYTEQLTCTEINPERLTNTNNRNVTFKICDAEKVGEVFQEKEFDMVFSSSLLEHLPNYDRALQGIRHVLADGGISIHFMPNRCWKLVTVLLHIPNKMAVTVDKLLAGRILKRRPGHKWFRSYKQQYGGNNIKVGRRRQFFLAKPFLPRIHGISDNTVAEFVAFGKKRWVRRFESAGFEVLGVKKLAYNSGYGFGFDTLRRLMEYMQIYCSYAYIMCKDDTGSKYAKFFVN